MNRSHLKMAAFLAVVASVCTLLLAGAQLAYERAAQRFTIRLQGQILELFDIPHAQEQIEPVFAEHFETRPIGQHVYYIARDGTIVFKTTGPGLWGRVDLLLAVEPDGRELRAMRVLAQAETPGLGGRIAEPQWQANFTGASLEPRLEIVKFASTPNQVDAVTGATKTSKAVEDIINGAIAQMRSDLQIGGE